MVTNSGQSVRLVQDASCVYRIKALPYINFRVFNGTKSRVARTMNRAIGGIINGALLQTFCLVARANRGLHDQAKNYQEYC